MGAIAFGLLGGEKDHSFGKWEAGQALYEVALRAVRERREDRYMNVKEFAVEWNAAKDFK